MDHGSSLLFKQTSHSGFQPTAGGIHHQLNFRKTVLKPSSSEVLDDMEYSMRGRWAGRICALIGVAAALYVIPGCSSKPGDLKSLATGAHGLA